jgi:hypothetical protein
VLGTSLGVLGWLLTQAATFGVAEHVHLTADGLTSHRHDYAAPLALGAAGAALAAALVLVVLLLGEPRASTSGARPSVVSRHVSTLGRTGPLVAAVLFVAVEAVELLGSGTPAPTVAAVLAAGAVLQLFTARVAGALARSLVRGIEELAHRPRPGHASRRVLRGRLSTLLAIDARRRRGSSWDGRAPPGGALSFVPTS